nr:hypothetical protein [Tanacetum cinerariifolium]
MMLVPKIVHLCSTKTTTFHGLLGFFVMQRDREVLVVETFHEQTNDELTEKEVKQMNGIVVAARAKGDLDEIEEVNSNCILMANLQQASTSGTKPPVYDSDGSVKYTKLLKPIPEPHQVQQNDSNVIYEDSSMEQSGGTKQQSLYSGKVLLEKHDPPTDIHNWSSFVQKDIHRIVKDEIFPIVNQVDARVQNFKIEFLKEAAKFVRDFKSLANEADESLAKHKALEFEIKRLLRAVVSQDTMFIMQNPTVVETSDLQTELEQCKYNKISYDKAYNDMKQKIERLQDQLGDLKGKSKDTPYVSDTLDPLSQKLENENVELELQEIWLRVQQMMKGSDIGIQEKKVKLFNEWERFTSNDGNRLSLTTISRHVFIVQQKKDLHTADYTQLYDFRKYNQKEVDELKVERLTKTQDPLARMANSNNPYNIPVLNQDQASFNQNYMQQPLLNPKDITDPTTAMNMALALMAKPFKLNYSTPTNNN